MTGMSSAQRKIEAALFDTGLAATAALARHARWSPLTNPLMRALAGAVGLYRGLRPSGPDAASLGRTWQRLMPNPRIVPITRVEGDTAFGEIHVHCPLRGTGDVQACHRLMEYDRSLMRPHGARFVVLRSQAEPGVTACQIAIRDASLPHDDLLAAHERPDVNARD